MTVYSARGLDLKIFPRPYPFLSATVKPLAFKDGAELYEKMEPFDPNVETLKDRDVIILLEYNGPDAVFYSIEYKDVE